MGRVVWRAFMGGKPALLVRAESGRGTAEEERDA